MSVAYFDTSALLKRYVTETGSRWVHTYLTASSGNDWFYWQSVLDEKQRLLGTHLQD